MQTSLLHALGSVKLPPTPPCYFAFKYLVWSDVPSYVWYYEIQVESVTKKVSKGNAITL